MWEAILYCLKCFVLVLSSSFGGNPSGLTWKVEIVGVLTFLGLIGLTFLIFYFADFVICKLK